MFIVFIALTFAEEETLNIKRRVQQKRKPLEGCCSFPTQVKAVEVRKNTTAAQSLKTSLPRNPTIHVTALIVIFSSQSLEDVDNNLNCLR